MTPDLTNAQTIGLASAIVGFCLTVFFTVLIVLTYGHQIRQYLRRRGVLVQPRPQTPAHLPFHYVLPFQRPEPARGQLADLAPLERQPTTAGPVQRRPTTYVASSSEELLQNREDPGPRNATPGPSNVPAPAANDRDILARYSWSNEHPPPYPEPRLPQRPVVPNRPRPRMEHPRPIPVFLDDLFRNFPADFADQPILIPDSDSDSSSDLAIERPPITPPNDDPLPFALETENEEPLVRVRRASDPLNPHAFDYDWPNLSQVDREILGPERVRAWELRQRDVDGRLERRGRHSRPRTSMDRFLATHRGDPLVGTSIEAQITARIFANRDRSVHGPAFGGNRLNNLRPRTPLEQRLLENHLRALSIRLRDRLLDEGRLEDADDIYVR